MNSFTSSLCHSSSALKILQFPVKPSGSRSRLKEKISWDKQGSVFNIFTKNVFSDVGPKSLQGRATLLWNPLSQPQQNKCCKQLLIYKTMACSTNIFMGHGNFYLEISRQQENIKDQEYHACMCVNRYLIHFSLLSIDTQKIDR